MAFLTVDAVSKIYEGVPLLTGVSFEVAQGEIVSLLGPSGSGKTTLLRIIAGLEPADGGRVLLAGQDVTGMPTHQRNIVLMFQEYALFPHRTVAENVAFGLRMRRWLKRDIEVRVQEMLALVGLEAFGPRNVIELSGGERQRVALARSLAPEPRLLLLDEPLGSLDRNLRERLLEDLAAILRRVGVTTIVVTHDQAEAFALADRAAVLHATRVVQMDRPDAIYRNPATPWVASFLGLTNLYPAEAVGDHQVRVPFGTLTLSPSVALPPAGATGTLLVLPWAVRLMTDATPRNDPHAINTFSGTVAQRIFQGRTTKLALAVHGELLRLTIQMGDSVAGEGDSVEGWLDPEALRWLDAGA